MVSTALLTFIVVIFLSFVQFELMKEKPISIVKLIKLPIMEA